MKVDQTRERPAAAEPAPSVDRNTQANQARAQERREGPPAPAAPRPSTDGWNGSAGGDADILRFRSLSREFKQAPAAVTPTYPPPPPPEQHDPAGPTPDLAERLSDVKDPQGRPVDGTGVTIGLIDEYNERTGVVGPHAAGTEETTQAVAPGTETSLYAMDGASAPLPENANEVHLPSDLADDPAALDRALLEQGPTMLTTTTDRLHALADDPNRDPNMRILNLSLGSARAYYYEGVLEKLNEKKEDGSYRYPQLRTDVFGDQPLSPEEEARRIAGYTDARLDDPDSAYSQALDRYTETTQRLAEPPNNIQLVVAAGNMGPEPLPDNGKTYPLPNRELWEGAHPGSCITDFSRSPDVIVVGAYDQKKSEPWNRSSWGEGNENLPGGPTMVMAPGNGTRYTQNPSTSAATPYVSGTLALMLQANPDLTPAELREILAASANPLPGVEERAQGVGLIDAEEAVRMAAAEAR